MPLRMRVNTDVIQYSDAVRDLSVLSSLWTDYEAVRE